MSRANHTIPHYQATPSSLHLLRATQWCIATLFFLILAGCQSGLEVPELVRIRERGKLIVLTRNAPTTLYKGPGRRMGFEHDLVTAFARHLQVTPEFVALDSTAEIYEALRQGKGDLAAAGLFRTEEGWQEFLYGPIYGEVQELVVCRRGNRLPGGIFQLNQVRFQIPEGSDHALRLNELQQDFPDLNLDQREGLPFEQVLEKIMRNELDCTIADSNVVRVNQRYFPDLEANFSIGDNRALSWVLPKKSRQLQQEMMVWFRQIQENGMLGEIHERYYGFGHPEEFDYVDVRTFHQRIENRLPYFIKLFKKAEKKYGVPWQILAAVSYQESHWNPWARSPTGVKGVMMLTNLTAQELRITNRLDPRESVMGAGWYLMDLMRRLPTEVPDSDRLWMALAAYNVGMGHLADARDLAKRLGRNPNSWVELREVLPLLSIPEYYETLKYGYARGSEPVRFVRKVRLFYDILEKKDENIVVKNNAELFRRASLGLPTPSPDWDDWQGMVGVMSEGNERLSLRSQTGNKSADGSQPPVAEPGINELTDPPQVDAMGSGDETPPPLPHTPKLGLNQP
ncbi:MAG: membrane-bound lytic murein transglycosylase MltF [Magnetococcales bacterium]|nr:membrane-bound lytic murein transglycosylase MltF [Magnetococcales bacterium]